MLVPILGLAFGQTLRSEEMAAWGSDRHPLVTATCLRKMKIKNQSQVADPYEGRWCQVLGSHLDQGGEGLFAKREVATVCWE